MNNNNYGVAKSGLDITVGTTAFAVGGTTGFVGGGLYFLNSALLDYSDWYYSHTVTPLSYGIEYVDPYRQKASNAVTDAFCYIGNC